MTVIDMPESISFFPQTEHGHKCFFFFLKKRKENEKAYIQTNVIYGVFKNISNQVNTPQPDTNSSYRW